MEYKKRIYANFGSIILLEYNPDIDYIVETLQLPEIINILEQQRINGVFSGTQEIEKTIEAPKTAIKDIIRNKDLNIVKVIQNCNNSKKILNEILRCKGDIGYDRE